MNHNDVLTALRLLSEKYLNETDKEVFQNKMSNPDEATAKFFLAEITLKKTKPFSDEDREILQDIDYYGL